ncbi:hypothetical protein F0267_17310 [Vibrio coralliilyticus]|nr:hypothetical protein [Vibrio coralliilyticus]
MLVLWMRLYSYIRFSTEKQKDGDSLSRQTEAAKRYAEQHDYDYQDSSFKDLGVSGWSKKERNGLESMLTAVERGSVAKGDMIFIENVDRLTRKGFQDANDLICQIVRMGVHMRFESEGITFTNEKDLNASMNVIRVSIAAEQANQESEKKSERIRASKATRFKEALKAGKRVSNGGYPTWLNVSKDTEPTFKPYAKETIQTIAKMYLNGRSIGDISKHLNNPENGDYWRQGEWNVGKVSRLLDQPALYGVHKSRTWKADGTRFESYARHNQDGVEIQGAYPVVISKTDYDLIQAKREHNKTNLPYMRGTNESTRSRGKLIFPESTCMFCGGNMRYKSSQDRAKSEFICANKKGAGVCDSASMNYMLAEQMLLGLVFQENNLAPLFSDDQPNQELKNKIEALEIERATTLEAIESKKAQGKRYGALQDEVGDIEDEIQALKKELQALETGSVSVYEEMRTWSSVWDADAEERNKVRIFLESIVEAIEITSIKRSTKTMAVQININGNQRRLIATSSGNKKQGKHTINYIKGLFEGVEV